MTSKNDRVADEEITVQIFLRTYIDTFRKYIILVFLLVVIGVSGTFLIHEREYIVSVAVSVPSVSDVPTIWAEQTQFMPPLSGDEGYTRIDAFELFRQNLGSFDLFADIARDELRSDKYSDQDLLRIFQRIQYQGSDTSGNIAFIYKENFPGTDLVTAFAQRAEHKAAELIRGDYMKRVEARLDAALISKETIQFGYQEKLKLQLFEANQQLNIAKSLGIESLDLDRFRDLPDSFQFDSSSVRYLIGVDALNQEMESLREKMKEIPVPANGLYLQEQIFWLNGIAEHLKSAPIKTAHLERLSVALPRGLSTATAAVVGGFAGGLASLIIIFALASYNRAGQRMPD